MFLSTPQILVCFVSVFIIACSSPLSAQSVKDVLNNYSEIALAAYSDSLKMAKGLDLEITKLASDPTQDTLDKARVAWIASRVPYQQTEVFRFGNSIVDDWEGKVNAWPLDEGLIDYVADEYGASSEDNPYYTANVIASKSIKLSGRDVDTSLITEELLESVLHESDGVEANVATGYHAIEFLLWGQDLNGTGKGAGTRPFSDFDTSNCSNKNCDRMLDYLQVASNLLISDLAWMVQHWPPNGEARKALLENEEQGMAAILKGMGSLSYGELAGERIKLGLILHDPEEEHDCFSDNTHNSHFYNIKGIQNVYAGEYLDVHGTKIVGPSLSGLVRKINKALDVGLVKKIEASLGAAQVLIDSAEVEGVAYDQLLAEGNESGNAKILGLLDALLEQTQAIQEVVKVMSPGDITFEGSESLDSPDAIFK
jgi:putative iron-regulated protein